MTPDNTTAKLELTIVLFESLKEECPLRADIINEHIEQIRGIIDEETNKHRALVDIVSRNGWGYTPKQNVTLDDFRTDIENS